ncbi:response regulator transcription factor [Streptomyces griseorubiginosus]|uniref:response regulator transcription factor n=1 Tax=Streptomyces griseorubiginosus TaxID=67304 RepID=UPI002E81E4DC|nr:response regulator transcription factor [Streptomyces griseorubiginosus]WUB42146.1 response regulator transcription factor [Streptomyces griseorubiginosus]WUB50665.1 response regulator transcription factor [Streptomyces griseorubiginosus]
MNARVLVAEDDTKQAEVIRRYLESEGHTALLVHDGRAALDEVRRHRPDLLVLDVMMPVVDGLDVCRILRRESDLPVLMLTARSTEEDLLLGLDLGADDYLTKPYSPRELMARVRTLLRRTRASGTVPNDPVLRVGALAVDPVRRVVEVEGRQVACTPGEFDVLATMAAEPERVFTRRQLLASTRGDDRYITERTIDVHVLNLRKKIERVPRRPAYLQTVFGVGYRLSDGSRGR